MLDRYTTRVLPVLQSSLLEVEVGRAGVGVGTRGGIEGVTLLYHNCSILSFMTVDRVVRHHGTSDECQRGILI